MMEREKEMEARREEDEREERRRAKEMESKPEEEERAITRHARLMEARREEKEMKEARYAWELELMHDCTQLKAQTENETAPAKYDHVISVSEGQRLIPRFTEESLDELFDHFEMVSAMMKCSEDEWSMLLQSARSFNRHSDHVSSIHRIMETSTEITNGTSSAFTTEVALRII
ncbi:uncharacterized protein [Palaemon carinicauda]|uniref:uncharacterized protein n=1 Tax=Palaemon carinicauda TaxID=392227 RepID=UPI0035B5CB60